MKILLVTKLYPGYPNQPRNEISYALHYFVKDWLKQGYDVRVVRIWTQYPGVFKAFNKYYMADEVFDFEEVKVHRVTINKIPKVDYLKSDIHKTYKKARKSIEDWGSPDVILCHMHNPNIYVAEKLKEDFKIPLLLTMHKTDINNLMSIRNRLTKFKKSLYAIDEIGFRSRVLYEKFQLLNVRNNRGFVIPSGIEKSIILSDEQLDDRKQFRIERFFIAANLTKQKKINDLIQAFAKASEHNKNIKLKIAGTGPEEQNLKSLITRLNMNEKIEMLGYLDRDLVLKEMENSDVFVMVSINETFGLVYLEAMAKGCITIGSRGEGIDGVIDSGVNGYLCEPGNIDELVTLIQKVVSLSNDDIYNLKLKSIQTAMKMSQENISNDYIRKIQEIINRI